MYAFLCSTLSCFSLSHYKYKDVDQLKKVLDVPWPWILFLTLTSTWLTKRWKLPNVSTPFTSTIIFFHLFLCFAFLICLPCVWWQVAGVFWASRHKIEPFHSGYQVTTLRFVNQQQTSLNTCLVKKTATLPIHPAQHLKRYNISLSYQPILWCKIQASFHCGYLQTYQTILLSLQKSFPLDKSPRGTTISSSFFVT